MKFKNLSLETGEIEMNKVPVNWGPEVWTYGKDREAERIAKEVGLWTEKSIFGELIEEGTNTVGPWKDFLTGALVIGTRTSERSMVKGAFFVSTEPFNYLETSCYKCPGCNGNVFYCASSGWTCENCQKTFDRSPAFMLGKKQQFAQKRVST